MINRWLFTKMWQYFDYRTNAIFEYSEEIGALPDADRKKIYAEIAARMEGYIKSLLNKPDVLYQYTGVIYDDIYRTMNRAMYYTWKQQEYLLATAGVVTRTLQNHGIAVHFGTNNSFANVIAVKMLLSAMWEDCGFCQVDVYSIAEKLARKTFSIHEELVKEYENNKDEVLLIAHQVVEKLNETDRSYALFIPDGGEDEFAPLLGTVGKPGRMILLKFTDADSSKISTFDYVPPTVGKNQALKEDATITHEKSCGAVVFTFHNEYPMVLVEYMKKGHVSLPKGHVEEGETEEETAAREIKEETNLIAYIDNVFRHEVTYSPKPGVQKTVVFFAATVDRVGDAKPQPEEVKELKWLGIDYAIKEMTYDTDKEVLHHAASYIVWRYYHTDWDSVTRPAFQKLLYREHAVDIHSHIIPGVDDGARDQEEAQDLAFLDREEGMDVVFATPHYGIENGYAPKHNLIRERFEELKERINWNQGDCPNALILPGTEWYCSDDIVERIRNKEAFPMGNSDWYLVEFLEYGDVTEPADIIIYRLAKMRLAGINTILAHPERYRAIQQDWNLAKRICDLGVLLQVNAYDLCLNKNDATRKLAQWMAQERLISFIGSDMHGTREGARRPQMKEGVRWLYEHTDEEYANDVVRRNAEKYLGVQKLPVEKNREYVPDLQRPV